MAGASFGMDMGPLKRMVAGATRHMARRQQVAEDIGEMLVSATQQRFEDEKGPDGTAWKPSHRAEAEGGKTLTDHATLKNSIGYEASPNLVVVGSNMEYARAHQEGMDISILSTRRRVTLPARPFIGINEEDMVEARQIMIDFMAEAFL